MLTSNSQLRQQLRENGLVGPFELEDQAGLQDLAASLRTGPRPGKNRHIDLPLVSGVFADKALQARVAEFFGKDLLLWRSSIIFKEPGTKKTRWHHDRHFETGDREINLTDLTNHFSILIAVTDMSAERGLIEYIEGSHLPLPGLERDLTPYHLKPPEEHFIPPPVQLYDRLRQLPMKAGQFALFHSGLLHHSKLFEYGDRRISMVGRLVRKGTRIPEALASPEHIATFN